MSPPQSPHGLDLDRNVGELPVPGTEEAGKRGRRSAADKLKESAQGLANSLRATLSTENLWEKKVRRRSYNAYVTRLHSKAAALGDIPHDEEAAEPSDKLYTIRQDVVDRKPCSIASAQILHRWSGS